MSSASGHEDPSLTRCFASSQPLATEEAFGKCSQANGKLKGRQRLKEQANKRFCITKLGPLSPLHMRLKIRKAEELAFLRMSFPAKQLTKNNNV